MKAVESEGNTLEQAVERALILLDLPREQVDVEIIQQPHLDGRTALVRVTPRGQTNDARVSRETSANQSAPGSGVRSPEEPEQARAVLGELLSHMRLACRLDPPIVEEDGRRVRLPISGEDAGLIIGRQGQTLDAIELIMNRIVERRWPGSSQLTVDAEDYRHRRATKLAEMAFEQARNVRRLGHSIALEPMSPRDRRSIHIALREEPGVSTRSEGEGQFRHVVIEPARPLESGASRPRFR